MMERGDWCREFLLKSCVLSCPSQLSSYAPSVSTYTRPLFPCASPLRLPALPPARRQVESTPPLHVAAMGSSLAEATELKNKGNEAFKKQDWPAAVEWYTKAIDAYDQEPSFYTNRAQVGAMPRTRPPS